MEDINLFCNECKSERQIIWFKTKDHYLDLNKGQINYNQFEDFTEQLDKCGLEVSELDYKTIEVRDPKSKKAIRIIRHECGPEISLLGFAKDLTIAGVIALIIEALKKILEKEAKKKNEKPTYAVYVFHGFNRIQINSFDEKTIAEAIEEEKEATIENVSVTAPLATQAPKNGL